MTSHEIEVITEAVKLVEDHIRKHYDGYHASAAFVKVAVLLAPEVAEALRAAAIVVPEGSAKDIVDNVLYRLEH